MEYLKELKTKFESITASLREELGAIRSNRPTPKLVENIKVNYLEQNLTVKQLGGISIELPRDIVITPWDRSCLASVVKAIEAANLGVSVIGQGDSVRVKLPELTNERRNELTKIVKSTAEEMRIRMRMERDAINKKVNEEADEDVKFKAKKELQEMVDLFNKSTDSLVENKTKELSE
ncbi:MAG: ribosome recycling factor [Candidatus Colwellbacteria bacterium]|nr:ribosome recycling factor [Candidatus Colwellbacteria bacterium]MBI3273965.1 ribosome recycling factor [Candidatus Colwellbacteria bacterium]